MPAEIPLDQVKIAAFCRKHGIIRLSLFGSVLRDDFDPQRSDIDVLIHFESGASQGLTYFDIAKMQFELEELFGRPVDLSLAENLDKYVRDEVLSTAEVQYDAA